MRGDEGVSYLKFSTERGKEEKEVSREIYILYSSKVKIREDI